MRLIEAELENICQHSSIKVKFDPGLTAVVGPNGSGKSNFLAAIYTCITGDWSRFTTTKTGVHSLYADKDDRSGMRVIMEHHGVRADIARMINPNERSLTIGDGTPITSDKLIDRAMERWFGLPLKVIGQYIFVPQWEMFALLNDGPAKRADNLYKLFGLDKSERCHTVIAKKLSTIAPKVLIDTDAVRSRLLANRNKLRELTSQLQTMSDHSGEITSLETIAKNWELRCELETELEDLQIDHETLRDSIEAESIRSEELEQKLIQLQVELNELEHSIDQARAEKIELDAYAALQLAKTKLEAEKRDVETRLGNLQEPIKPYGADDNTLETRVAALSEVLKDAHKLLDHIHDDSVACPTCNTPVEELHEQLDKARETICRDQPVLEDLATQLHRQKKYLQQLATYSAATEQLKTQMAYIDEKINDIPSMPIPSRSAEEVQGIISQFNQRQQSLEAMRKDHYTCAHSVSNMQGQLQKVIDDIDETQARLSAISVTEQDADDATLLLAARRSEEKLHQQLTSESHILRRVISLDEVALEDAQVTITHADKLESWRTELSNVRDVLGRDALPKMIAQSHLEKLEATMNASLDELGVDFRVKTDENLRFQVSFADGIRNLPAESLSGGEKVVFALAWRLAVNSEFASDVGILCLDEPTAGLDKDRLSCLKTAIEHMRVMSHSRGLQCIIITHAEELIPLFDSVIELKPPTV